MEMEGRSLLRSLAKTGVACALSWTGADKLLGILDDSTNRPLVLCYHRVVEDFAADGSAYLPPMLISCRMLEQQLDWIGRSYRFVSLDELASSLEAEEKSAKPVVAVTFDDGYADVYHNAFPLLKRMGIPAAVFVVTDLIGASNLQIHDKLFLLLSAAFSPQSAAKRDLVKFLERQGIRLPGIEKFSNGSWNPPKLVGSLLEALSQAEICRLLDILEGETETEIEESLLDAHRHLDWEMISEMERGGMTIGSHTASHPVLINESPAKILSEMKDSREKLEKKLGIKIEHFAYPDGQFNAVSVKAAAAAGYRAAYTICRHRDPFYPLLTVPRLALWENSCLDARGRFSSAILDCQVSGLFDFVNACKRMHRPIRRENGSRFELGQGK